MCAGAVAAVSALLLPSCSEEKKKAAPDSQQVAANDTPLTEVLKKDDEAKNKTAFPTLDILPEGSMLLRVRLPRYDKDFNPLSLLAADKLTVLDRNRIEAEGVSIEMYNKDGSLQARTKMSHAIYNQLDSSLVAKEAIYIQGEGFRASGTGLILDWKTGRGFLVGPASTKFEIKESEATNNTPQS